MVQGQHPVHPLTPRGISGGTRTVLRGHPGHVGARLSALRPVMRKEIQLVARSQGDQHDLEPASTSNAYRTDKQPREASQGSRHLGCLVLNVPPPPSRCSNSLPQRYDREILAPVQVMLGPHLSQTGRSKFSSIPPAPRTKHPAGMSKGLLLGAGTLPSRWDSGSECPQRTVQTCSNHLRTG